MDLGPGHAAFIAALKQEQRRLHDEARAIQARLTKIENLLDEYTSPLTVAAASSTAATHPPLASRSEAIQAIPATATTPAAETAPASRTDTKRALARAAVTDYLGRHGAKHRDDILAELRSRGLLGDERDPMRALSRLLSSSKDLVVGKGGGVWELRLQTAAKNGAAAMPRERHHRTEAARRGDDPAPPNSAGR